MPNVIRSTPAIKPSVELLAASANFRNQFLGGVLAAQRRELDFRTHELSIIDAARKLATAGVREVAASTAPTAEFVHVDGVRHKPMTTASPGLCDGLDGSLRVERHLYRQLGVHNGSTIDPITVRCGMIDGRFTPAAAWPP